MRSFEEWTSIQLQRKQELSQADSSNLPMEKNKRFYKQILGFLFKIHVCGHSILDKNTNLYFVYQHLWSVPLLPIPLLPVVRLISPNNLEVY